jgi:hypothetical protein
MTTRAPKPPWELFSVALDVAKALAVVALLKASVDPLAGSSQSEPEVLADVAISTLPSSSCSMAELARGNRG